MLNRVSFFSAVATSLLTAGLASSQMPTFAHPQARIIRSVDESTRVTLQGNVHPLASAARLSKPADVSTPMEHMILYLKADSTQEAQLAQLIAQQNDPKSSLFHQFLTPQSFGAQFGVAKADIAKVTAWLQSHGFTVEEMSAGNRAIIFSGNAAQVAAAFNTEIRSFTSGGASHVANTTDPQIPAAMAGIVGGIVKLHDFRHSANLSKAVPVSSAQLASPKYNYGTGHYLSPADYKTIYNLSPLYSAGVNGAGQTIAVLARSNIFMSDVTTFRTQMGLTANNPQIVITSSDPGVLQGDSVETTLDTEWSGAIAPNAVVKVIVAASTYSADGIDLSALYAVNHNVAPIISLSYGSCEAGMGSSELAFYNSLWQQAAAQGQSVFVSSGDSGAAGCYGGSSTSGSGQAVNGLCSSPYATCVGGTQFVEGSNPGQYWLPGNNASYGSAISYIPETVWNESGSNGGSGLWAGGGGSSIAFTKPSWQSGPGVPADGRRDVPDISLTASSHDGYLVWLYGNLNSVGGTSASAPAFAGIMALVDQKSGKAQGLANAILYSLATSQAAGGAKIFHDTVTGSNSVPGVPGFAATAGYDRATGLGSVDAGMLVNHWSDGSTTTAPSLALSASTNSLNLVAGKTAQVTFTSIASSALNSAIALTVTGAPAGLTATLSAASIAAPGSGSVLLNLIASSSALPGTYTLTVTGTGGGKTAQATVSVVIPAPTFALATNSSTLALVAGNTTPLSVSTSPQNGFNTAVALSVSGLPTGLTASFSPATIGATGGIATLTLTSAKTTAAGTYPLVITAKGGSITQTATVTLVVSVPASCTLAINPSSLQTDAGAAPTALQVSCGSVKGNFSGPLSLSLSGAPASMTAQFSAATLTPGATSVLTIGTASTMASGTYNLVLTATGSGFTQTLSLPVTVSAVNSFRIAAAQSVITAKTGATAQVGIVSTLINKYNGAVSFSVSGLPSGVTASFSPSSLPAPGNGATVATFAIGSTVKPGTYNLLLTGAGSGGIVQTAPVTLTIPGGGPDFSFALSSNAITIPQGSKTPLTISAGNYTGGFNGQISMSFSGLAPGMNWAFVAGTAANNWVNITINFSAATYTPVGTYAMTVTDTGSGGVVHSGVVQVTITAPQTAATK